MNLFSCIICKELAVANNPQCCSGVVVCRQCIEGWIEHSPTCPQCRGSISIDICLPFPPYRPLAVAKEDGELNSDVIVVYMALSIIYSCTKCHECMTARTRTKLNFRKAKSTESTNGVVVNK